jgi:hypothetical protein
MNASNNVTGKGPTEGKEIMMQQNNILLTHVTLLRLS